MRRRPPKSLNPLGNFFIDLPVNGHAPEGPGANIRPPGGVSFAGTVNDVVVFKKVSNVWCEAPRSVN